MLIWLSLVKPTLSPTFCPCGPPRLPKHNAIDATRARRRGVAVWCRSDQPAARRCSRRDRTWCRILVRPGLIHLLILLLLVVRLNFTPPESSLPGSTIIETGSRASSRTQCAARNHAPRGMSGRLSVRHDGALGADAQRRGVASTKARRAASSGDGGSTAGSARASGERGSIAGSA